ncbi:MAG: GntP family permease [Eubacteriaceae bacterium]|jgi:GntP family gluconate:H+ symporter|nr:GntP family permease [Eubacteriaceae bacterium]
MATGQIILAFILALAFVLITIIKFNMHPFFSLLLGGLLMGVISGIGLLEISAGLAAGFGSTMAGIGILIISGVILGELLHASGCMEEIANLFIQKLGIENTPLAMNLTGYLVSIPVFFDAAFVILVNLAKSLSQKGKIPFVSLVTALSVGLITTHAMVIPTPGPTAVAGTMGANVGWFIFYGIITSLIGSVTGGVIYGRFLGKTAEFKDNFAQDFKEAEAVADQNSGNNVKKPSGETGILLILLPILFILVGTIVTMFLEKGTMMHTIFGFIGDKNVALITAVLISYAVLKDSLKKDLNEMTSSATSQAGAILAITGAGGAFGSIITLSGIGEVIVEGLSSMTSSTGAGTVVILAAFMISALLRIAQGSTTVALVTTSAIFAPIVTGLAGTSPVLVGLAICAGGLGFSLPNDSGFWVVNRFSNFTTQQTLKVWTVGGSVSGLAALLAVVILSFLSGVLPGLM